MNNTETQLFILRHGPTAWNKARRIQGHSDVPLLVSSAAQIQRWRLPKTLRTAQWHASPLQRARQTAQFMGAPEPAIDEALTEMNWGEWEGKTLAELRDALGEAMTRNEARGLDFRPDGGESPREVQDRLKPWLASLAASDQQVHIAVAHKGVIRALYALATGWDMTGKPPEKLREPCGHLFQIAADGTPNLVELNVSLLPDEAS